jgi:hypothetical protein
VVETGLDGDYKKLLKQIETDFITEILICGASEYTSP